MMLSVFLLLISFVCSGLSYNILAVYPFQSKSHYAIIDPLMVRLAELGHNITIYDPFPKKQAISNYHEIDISECFTFPGDFTSIEGIQSIISSNRYFALFILFFTGRNLFNEGTIEQCLPLKALMNSTDKYDLFMTESFISDVMLLFANKFQTPFITYMPNTLFPWLSNRMANPMNPSYIPISVSLCLSRMTFFERVHNTLLSFLSSILYDQIILKHDERIIKNYLGSSAPSIFDTVKNTSIMFISSHESLNPVIPLVPGVIPIAGIHIKPVAPLPKNIEKFINESQHGVIYFCMGSLLRGETFPEEKRNAFLYAFSKVPQRVLWKWEGDVLPGKSDNIMISKWMPQRDILAHPNIKLFISHGGLLGTSEAVYEGVPVLGIPIFGDQRTNIKALEANGAGELLDYNEISGEVVLEKIQRLVNDPKYSENAKQLSARYRDRPMSPLDTAVYWTEYVIRHKGAPHLKTAAVDMPWYQYLLLDVIAFLLFIFVSVLLIIYYSVKISLRFLYSLICGKSSSSKSAKKVKRN